MPPRGRKSAASKEVKSAQLPGQRPEPPPGLTEFQSEEWRAIVGRLPSDWFSRETHGLLIQYVRHAENALKLSVILDTFPLADLNDEAGTERFDKLTKMFEREGRAMSSLATRMRLTQQSRYNALNANTASKKSGANTKKPWES